MLISLIALIFTQTIYAKPKIEKTLPCEEATPILVKVPPSKVTVLNFPVKPKEIVPGEGGFDFKTIRNDLIIKSLGGRSTNLFVYLESRRCFFHLISSSPGDEILFIRDPKDKNIEVKFK